jgi:tetratricopeptide (TPR) repeat protein
MSKKKRKSQRKKHTAHQKHRPIPDRRAMEKTLADIGRILNEQEFESVDEANAFLNKMLASGEPLPASTETPLEKAQELMYEAWESSGKRRTLLVQEALKISEDCADAYVLLAEESARNLAEAKELYEKGVEAGERALGEEIFSEPYMRARAGLAQCLWLLGQHQEAITHLKEMLRLNPGDNQGVRYFLSTCLLEEGMDEELAKLLKEYDEDASASWAYTRALLAFRQGGMTEKAGRQLKEALARNPFVPAYLLGKKKLPRQMPGYVGFGDENEAIDYAAAAISVWAKTKGALDWLNVNLNQN